MLLKKKEKVKFQDKLISIEPWLHMDYLKYENGKLMLAGWVQYPTNMYDKLELYIINKDGESTLPLQNKLLRNDVSEVLKNEDYKYSGFLTDVPIKTYVNFYLFVKIIKGNEIIATSLIGKIKFRFTEKFNNIISKINKDNIKRLCFFIRNRRLKELIQVLSKPITCTEEKSENRIDLQSTLNLFLNEYKHLIIKQQIDIIVPVYNGLNYFERLFESIEKTNVSHRVIIVNDCSTDNKVTPYLKKLVNSKKNYILIENSLNQGFVKSVNIALKQVKNHVALINTDIELPDFWLERLMNPILNEKKVASSTPYTNCGTICSFPEFLEDNELYLNLSLKEIDNIFQKVQPRYLEMPTGVGFCMGMNYDVLSKIGYFDEESFGKGYGEENDWCQRAIKEGYRNVQVENLFVYHKHGGSFASEEKKCLIEINQKKLSLKHPKYNEAVATFINKDENYDIRKIVKLILKNKYYNEKLELVFTHNIGGGADLYLKKKIQKELKENPKYLYIVVYYMPNYGIYGVDFIDREEIVKTTINALKEIDILLPYCTINNICINELVTYPQMYETLKFILEIKRKTGAKLIYLLHDYYCICPGINLMNKNTFCNIPELNICKECEISNLQYKINEWRQNWKKFLEECDIITAFSQDSHQLLKKSYPQVKNIIVKPHDCSYMIPLEKKYKKTEQITIGVLGVLVAHKGLEIIKKMIQIIEEKKLKIRIVLIGETIEKIDSNSFYQTGQYKISEIPRLTLEYDIDIFFISSIWPETFSYTAEEVMRMGIPIVSFNLGASAERIKKYEKGTIIKKIDANLALDTIAETVKKYLIPMQNFSKKKVLILIDSYTFSTRYRMDHLSEMLQMQGFSVDMIKINEFQKQLIGSYIKVILYRLPYSMILEKIINKVKNNGIELIYDIDDYIFDYAKIKNLKFLNQDEYKDFEEYTSNIYKAMFLCDKYMTSTNTLGNEIEHTFNKKVYIFRNVASMEMEILSRLALETKWNNKSNIILGYFSGSKTHNKDFEQIEDIILDIMKENKKVYLKIGGVLELSPKFEEVQKQIIRVPFLDWRELPKEIAEIDINLMPLEDTLFHACKSENKWMEAALVKVVTIASENIELKQIINNGIDGVLCKTNKEWKIQLKKLIDEEQYRNQLASQACFRVYKEYLTRKAQFRLDLLIGKIK